MSNEQMILFRARMDKLEANLAKLNESNKEHEVTGTYLHQK